MKNFLIYSLCTLSIVGLIVLVAIDSEDNLFLALLCLVWLMLLVWSGKRFKKVWKWYYEVNIKWLKNFRKEYEYIINIIITI